MPKQALPCTSTRPCHAPVPIIVCLSTGLRRRALKSLRCLATSPAKGAAASPILPSASEAARRRYSDGHKTLRPGAGVRELQKRLAVGPNKPCHAPAPSLAMHLFPSSCLFLRRIAATSRMFQCQDCTFTGLLYVSRALCFLSVLQVYTNIDLPGGRGEGAKE